MSSVWLFVVVCYRHFATQALSAKIVAGTRDTTSDRVKELLVDSNVTLVKSDIGDAASLGAAVAGADVVLVNVPGHQNRTQQGLNGINAAKAAGVSRLVDV
jgi:uncharacterized protein YbjT (DUF2867 family)